MTVMQFANSLKLDKRGNTVLFDNNPAEQAKVLKRLKTNRLFKLINIRETRFEEGNAMGLYVPIAGTTDTAAGETREPKKTLSPAAEYHCQQLNIDGYLHYTQLDACNLEESPETAVLRLLDAQVLKGVLMAGWQGVRRAATSDPTQNPLAQDTHLGWLQKIRDGKPAAVINGAEVGEGKTYKTLNALIKAGLAKIEPAYAMGGDMVAICGREIVGNSETTLNLADLNEDLGEFLTLSQRKIGGLPVLTIPYFPSNAILITSLRNLSLYVHLNNIRRFMLEEPAKDRLANYFSMPVDYIVEDFNACCLIENIEIAD